MATIHEMPDSPADDSGLTLRQRRVLEVIRQSVEDRGYPPSVREIGEAVGLNSPSSVAHQLKVLETKGFLRRDPNRPRAMELLDPDATGYDPTDVGDALPSAVMVPVVGRIAAGGPILAEQAIEAVFPLPQELVGGGELFLLRVAGDSMIDAAIFDGEFAPSATNKPGVIMSFPTPIRGTNDFVLRVTTTNAQSITITVWGYEV